MVQKIDSKTKHKVRFRYTLVLILQISLISILLFIGTGFVECGNNGNFPLLWLEFGQKSYETDGSATQTVNIKSSDASLNITDIQDLTAFYTDGQQRGERQYYSIPIEQQNGRYFLKVNTASQFRYQIYVTGTRQEERYTAQIFFPLYANSLHKNQEKKQMLPKNIRPFASIDQQSQNAYWWPQTGQPFRFSYNSGDRASAFVNEITIMDMSNNSAEKTIADSVGVFSFTPAHDQRLNNKGNYGYKELLIYAEERVGNTVYKTSMNYLVHRSFTAQRDLKTGTFLFFATMAACLAIVLIRRRRFNYR